MGETNFNIPNIIVWCLNVVMTFVMIIQAIGACQITIEVLKNVSRILS